MKFEVKNLRYCFPGNYHTDIFSLRESSDPEAYAKLKKLVVALDKKFDTYLPVHEKVIGDEDFLSLVLRGASDLMHLKHKDKRSIYDVSFKVKVVKGSNGKQYVNLWLSKIKFIKKDVVDQGEELDIEL